MKVPESLGPLRRTLENYYANMHASMEQVRRLYDQQFDYIFQKYQYDIEIHRTATPTNIVEGMRNQVRSDQPTVRFAPVSYSRDNQAHAKLMEQWGLAMLERLRAGSEVDPDLEAAFDLILPGATARKIVVDETSVPMHPETSNKKSLAWRQYQDQLASYWPFVIRALDPITVYPPPGLRHPLAYVMEVQQRRVVDMWDEYPAWPDPKAAILERQEAGNPARVVDWVELWTPERYVIEADGARVYDQPNPYGFVPYIFEFSGLGHRDASGDPAHLARGILHSVVGELEEEVRVKTAISVQTQMHVFPTLLTQEDPNTVAKQFTVGPGRILHWKPGTQKPEWLEHPPPNENFYRYLDRIEANISRVANAALFGLREPGVDYGILQAQMVGQALKSISPIRATLDRIGTQTLNMMARMMYVRELAMTLRGTSERGGGKTVSPEDFRHYNFSVSYESIDPAENDRMIQIGELMRRAGDLSRRTLWSKFAPHIVQDPDQEEAELGAEQVINQMIQSGMLSQIILSEEQQAAVQSQAGSMVEQVRQSLEQGTVAQSALPAALARKTEAVAGQPGLVAEPLATARQAQVESLGGQRR